MAGMFWNATSFDRPLDNWDTSNVTTMRLMFRSASAFNQTLGDWDVSAVTTMEDMLTNAGLDQANYDATLAGWASLPTLQRGVPLDAVGLTFCAAATARMTLIDTYGWVINFDRSC